MPSAKEANGVICAQQEVPEFAPAGFFVQVGQDEVIDGEGTEGADLGKEDGDLASAVEDEVDTWLSELFELAGQFLDGDGIAPVNTGKVDEGDVLVEIGGGVVPHSVSLQAEDFTMDTEGLSHVGGGGIEAPNAGLSTFH